MLQVSDLQAWRGNACLFEGLAFTVNPGGALLLRGANGAGKTTLLRVLCGLTRPQAGQVSWQGMPCPDGVRAMAAYGGHLPALNQDLSVDQNMAFYAGLQGRKGDWPTVLAALGLERCRDLEVRRLSAGQRRKAGLVRVLVSGLPLWLLDEPFTNVDAAGRQVMESLIARHLQAGGLAVIAMHDELDLDGCDIATLRLGRS